MTTIPKIIIATITQEVLIKTMSYSSRNILIILNSLTVLIYPAFKVMWVSSMSISDMKYKENNKEYSND